MNGNFKSIVQELLKIVRVSDININHGDCKSSRIGKDEIAVDLLRL